MRVNAAIFGEFIRLAGDDGVIPLIVYFPYRRDILQFSRGEQTAAAKCLGPV